jgi:hypothetical protein
MSKSINLNMLKDEIDSRKREKGLISVNTNGETINVPARDKFLNGLLESFDTGRETHSTVVVKEVVNRVAEKANEKAPIRSVGSVQAPTPQPSHKRITENDMSPERDEQLFADLQKRRSQTLADSIQDFSKIPSVGAPMTNQPQYNGAPQQLNEAYLTENVKKIVNNYLVENFGPIVEEAIKSTILEMYAVERIKEVLQENKELVRTVVYDVFREIREKQNAKKV